MPNNSPECPPEIIDQLVSETLPLGYIYWDTEGNGLGCSSDVIELFDLKTCQEVFEHWDSLFPDMQPTGDESKPFFAKILAQVQEHGRIIINWQFQTIRGEPIPVEMTVSGTVSTVMTSSLSIFAISGNRK